MVQECASQNKIILWLALLNKLKTKDRLFKMGVTPRDSCSLCSTESETINHLFFVCRFSTKCLEATLAWLGSKVQITSLSNLPSKKWRIPIARKKVFCIALSCLVYQIWKSRNEAIWQAIVKSNERVLKNLKREVKAQFSIICAKEIEKDASQLNVQDHE